MKFRVGIKNNNEGIHSIAGMLKYPGCDAYGGNDRETLNSGILQTYVTH
ncbi:MAG: hypothetical protein AB1649_24155 [Chloroflexota bacterium]